MILPVTQLQAGAQVGPYRLEARIGAGGMGEVFRAVDTRLRRTVAIKFLLPERMNEAAHRHRFLHEARAAAALNHPHIAVLHDISQYDGMDFLVLEYVAGQTLKILIPAGGMPLKSVAQVGAQTASALAAAHAVGIVHRDVKPANIMITAEQVVKVLDFGVAKMNPIVDIEGDAETRTVVQDTIPGMTVGTVSYMSPEQTRGEAVDGRSDIFSLGCVLYEAATGRLPFRGASLLATMHEIATANPPAPSTFCPDLPERFDALVAACLSKKPGDRPASAAEVEQELKLLNGANALTERPAVRRSESRSAVGVLPFRFRTPAAEDQFLSVALADAVANRLASTGKLLVRPTASVLKFANQEAEWPHAARELNVDLIVEGTLQKLGPRIRVMIQAHRVADEVTLHSARYDGTMEDLFELQDRISDGVAETLAPRQGTTEPTAVPPTTNSLAFELYLRGVERLPHMNKFDTGSAIEMLTRATDVDPNFADAWGRLAQAYTQMGAHLDPDAKWFEGAEHAIARALELDPLQCHAQCARGQILWSPSRSFQNRAALRAMNAALKIDPHRPDARQFRGAILFHLGFHGLAARDCEESLLANPRFAMGFGTLGTIALYRGDYDKATDFYERALNLDPGLVLVHIFSPLAPLAAGRLGEAREKLTRARQMVPQEPQIICIGGMLAAHDGDFQRAEQLADAAVAAQRSLTHTHHTWHCAAGVYAMGGKREKAVAQLRRCAELGLPNFRLFHRDPFLRSLHDDPDFAVLQSELRRQFEGLREEFGLDPAEQP